MNKLYKKNFQQENIKTVNESFELLKSEKAQQQWAEINESEPEYITVKERSALNDLKSKGEFIIQSDLLNVLEIHEDEI